MLLKYTIHKIGTPKVAFPNHRSYWESEYWNNRNGWGHKSTATVFEDKNYSLPIDGEWVEIYVNEPVEEKMLKTYTVTATGIYFIQAINEIEAQDIIYEVMLGKGDISILGRGEVDYYGIKAVEGYHSTIERAD